MRSITAASLTQFSVKQDVRALQCVQNTIMRTSTRQVSGNYPKVAVSSLLLKALAHFL